MTRGGDGDGATRLVPSQTINAHTFRQGDIASAYTLPRPPPDRDRSLSDEVELG